MKIEIVKQDAVSTTEDTYKEIAEKIYQRDSDGAILIIGVDKALLIDINSFCC